MPDGPSARPSSFAIFALGGRLPLMRSRGTKRADCPQKKPGDQRRKSKGGTIRNQCTPRPINGGMRNQRMKVSANTIAVLGRR